MNTFLAYADYDLSVKVLDDIRLRNQRNEVLVMARGGWPHHPCSKMWSRNRQALILYGLTVCGECQFRGFADSVWEQLYAMYDDSSTPKMPSWFGSQMLHSSHRMNLRRKDKGYYDFPDNPFHNYFWPSPTYDWRTQKNDCFDSYTSRRLNRVDNLRSVNSSGGLHNV